MSNTLSRGGFDPIEDKSHTLRAERIAAGVVIFDDCNQCVKKGQSTIGTITANIGSKTFRNGTKLLIKNATKKGYIEAKANDCIDLSHPNSKTKRDRVQSGISQTVMTSAEIGVLEDEGDL